MASVLVGRATNLWVRYRKVNDRLLGIRCHSALFHSPITPCVRQKRKTEAEKELPKFPQAINSTPKGQPRHLDLWTMLLPLGHTCCHISPNLWKRGVKERHPESRHCEASSAASALKETSSDVRLFKCRGRAGRGANQNNLRVRLNEDTPPWSEHCLDGSTS